MSALAAILERQLTTRCPADECTLSQPRTVKCPRSDFLRTSLFFVDTVVNLFPYLSLYLQYRWLVWRSGNGVRHFNEVTLLRVRLVLGLVTTFGGSTIPVFIHATQAHSAWPSLRGYCGTSRNEYRRRFWPCLGRNGASEVTTLRRCINQFLNVNTV